MCYTCHQGISDDVIISQLKEASEEHFCRWNTTSLAHILIAGMGFNGPEARHLAIGVLERFVEWRKTQPLYYVPESGLFEIPPADSIQIDLDIIKSFSPDYSDKHTIFEKYTEFDANYRNQGI